MFPGEFGVPKSYLFPLESIGNWCENKVVKKNDKSNSFIGLILKKWFGIISKNDIIQKEIRKFNNNSLKQEILQDSIEKIDSELEAGIEVEDLHKVYTRANNHALKGLTVKFYKNEISSFLGGYIYISYFIS